MKDLTRNYKKDFIDSVNTAKAKIVEAKETNLKIQKAAEKTYKSCYKRICKSNSR